MPNENRKNQSNLFTTTAIGVGVGALAAVGGYIYGRITGAEEARQEHAHAHHSSASATATADDQMNAKKVGVDQEQRECGICFRDFDSVKANNEEIHTTPCGHVFCKHCLQSSLNKKKECPFCRRVVEPNQTLRLYL